MPKKNGIPKSILADINKLKSRLASMEKSNASMMKDFKANMKTHTDWLRSGKSGNPARTTSSSRTR